MIAIILNDKDRQLAAQRAKDVGVLRHSITGGQGNLAAALGEIAVCRYLGCTFGEDTFQYDLILHDGRSVDVKTKNCTSAPKTNYLVSVAGCTPRQRCDLYLFVRVLKPSYGICWLLGYMPAQEFFAKATFGKKGAVDPSGHGGWRFKEDCHNLTIRSLYPCDQLLPLSALANEAARS